MTVKDSRRIVAGPGVLEQEEDYLTYVAPYLLEDEPNTFWLYCAYCDAARDPEQGCPSDGELINEYFDGSLTKFAKALRLLADYDLLSVEVTKTEKIVTVYNLPEYDEEVNGISRETNCSER